MTRSFFLLEHRDTEILYFKRKGRKDAKILLKSETATFCVLGVSFSVSLCLCVQIKKFFASWRLCV